MVVLFDVDHTLADANCTAALARALAADGVVPRTVVLAVALRQVLYRLKQQPFSALMAAAYGLIEGRTIAHVEASAARVVRDVVAPALYPEARDRIARHRARGDRVVLASAAPAVVIERVSAYLAGAHLGVDGWIATEFHRDGERFGPVVSPPACGPGKVELARRAGLFDEGPPHVYTDHPEDWPLVLASGFSTLVNPAPSFAEEVGRRGVPHEIVRWARRRRAGEEGRSLPAAQERKGAGAQKGGTSTLRY